LLLLAFAVAFGVVPLFQVSGSYAKKDAGTLFSLSESGASVFRAVDPLANWFLKAVKVYSTGRLVSREIRS
jgi:hypothetical protein